MIWDVIVIGAGAAGLMCSLTCAQQGFKTLLLDSKEQIGAKILMSGGTRCNITNHKITEFDYHSDHSLKIVRHILQVFPSDKVVQFFKAAGVEVTLEAGGKYFPSTHSAKTVLDALIKEVRKSGCQLVTQKKVSDILFSDPDQFFTVSGFDFNYQAKTIALATGGLSYPGTGSDGSGYSLAAKFGHQLVATSAALTPLLTKDSDFKSLSGVSLPVRLTLTDENKKKTSYEGDFLFTHFGFSGPTALDISRHWARQKNPELSKMTANLLPNHDQDKFRNDLIDMPEEKRTKSISAILSGSLPQRLLELLLSKCGLAPQKQISQITRQERNLLMKSLFEMELPIHGVFGYSKAEVTAGGIGLHEINTKTMESLKQPGIFFAGEILDVDGRIGGFNFQWAWASSVCAAQGIMRKLRQKDPSDSVDNISSQEN